MALPQNGPSATVRRIGRVGVVAAWAALACLVGIGAVHLADDYLLPVGVGWDARPVILLVSLVVLNAVGFLAWPSRYNVVAHMQIAFGVVAYAFPVLLLGDVTAWEGETLDSYFLVLAVGALSAVVGTYTGTAMAVTKVSDSLAARVDFGPRVAERVARRALVLGGLSSIGAFIAFAWMGFAPALTEDPIAAKFFRGAYAEPYAPVAPLYRATTTVLSLIIPLVAYAAWRLRSKTALVVLAASTLVLLLGLLREPAVSGILLFIGVLVAVRGRSLLLYYLLLLGAYIAGGALYFLLAHLGVGGYVAGSTGSLVAQASQGAPDVRDQLTFLQAWLARPELTYGRTFLGGLVPGNYEWNPSVYSLRVVNPGVELRDIYSGGFRMPAPIWGLASFGWPGVVLVSFAYGLLSGVVTRILARLVSVGSALGSVTLWTVMYVGVTDVVPQFFRLGYTSVLQLLAVVVLLLWGTGAVRGSAVTPGTAPRPEHTTEREGLIGRRLTSVPETPTDPPDRRAGDVRQDW